MNKRKEDDPQWLQALQKKNQIRSKRQRQVLIQKILIAVFVITAAAAVFFAVSGREKKSGNPQPDIAAAPNDSKDPDAAAEQDGESETGKTETEELDDAGSNDADSGDTEPGNAESNELNSGNAKPNGSNSDDAKQNDSNSSDMNPDDSGSENADSKAGDSNAAGSADKGRHEDSKYAWTEKTRTLGNGISSSHAVFIDMENGTVLACKDEAARIVPASMTKVLTLLTAVEHLDAADLDDKFKITVDITDYSYVNGCSSAGFGIDEKVTVRDLLYGTILPSGADAALGLAIYTAGSQEAFVEWMNEKLEELGLSKTAHFTNCVGLYDEDHYCTILDMAVIMEAALANELCREVLSAHTYTTSKTKQHPEGITISNWFLRRIEDKDTGGEVVCAKTGYVAEAGNCAVSYGVDEKGRNCVCVTADAPGSWKCIYDHVKIYKRFSKRK